MKIYAISDLHLSFAQNKTMDAFGEHWKEHYLKIENNWRNKIHQQDLVLICGDISWAMSINDALPDLQFIDNLPGTKILIKGNHDFWWNSTSKLNEQFKTMSFLKNDCVLINEYAICGTRGWICPNDKYFTMHDEKLYKREVNRLKLSLDKANGHENIILMMHYPPTNDKSEFTEFIKLINEYKVKKVLYGHLHLPIVWLPKYLGYVNNVEYFLTSADYISFEPVEIMACFKNC